MHVALLCGSLRRRSSNRAVLDAYRQLSPDGVTFDAYDRLAQLPHFSPDVADEHLPEPVVDLRRRLVAADAVVISTPEYAHGLPGTFKNALDWMVGEPAFAGKRVAILHIDRGSNWALDSLREILRTMAAQIDEAASVSLRLSSNQVDGDGILAQPSLRAALQRSMIALVATPVP